MNWRRIGIEGIGIEGIGIEGIGIDGIDLRARAALGQARHLPDGAYETPRATLAGQQVWREYEALTADSGRRRLLWFR